MAVCVNGPAGTPLTVLPLYCRACASLAFFACEGFFFWRTLLSSVFRTAPTLTSDLKTDHPEVTGLLALVRDAPAAFSSTLVGVPRSLRSPRSLSLAFSRKVTLHVVSVPSLVPRGARARRLERRGLHGALAALRAPRS